jgi:hypothetical protein
MRRAAVLALVAALLCQGGYAKAKQPCEVKYCINKDECHAMLFTLPKISLPIDIAFLVDVDGIHFSLKGLIDRIVLGWHDVTVTLLAGEVQAEDFESVIIDRYGDLVIPA